MKQVFNISSNNPGNAADQVLVVRIGERHAGFAVCSSNHEELFELAWYTGTDMDTDSLEEIFRTHTSLKSAYLKTAVCFDHLQNVLIPQPVFQEAQAEQLLKAMHPESSGLEFGNDVVEGWQVNNFYAVPPSVKHWVQSHFPRAVFHHADTIGIKSIEATNFEGSLSASFRTDDFELLVSKANKLLLAQTYQYSTPADVIYIMLDVCRQFAFSQESVRVAIAGLIEKESSLYRELYQYFLNVRFREPGWTLVSATPSEYPDHFFTSLNDLAKCAS